jgi:hypothetical protein
LKEEYRDKKCPNCSEGFFSKFSKGKLVSAKERLCSHQEETQHCYCIEHKAAFDSIQSYEDHRKEMHGSSLEQSRAKQVHRQSPM